MKWAFAFGAFGGAVGAAEAIWRHSLVEAWAWGLLSLYALTDLAKELYRAR